MMKSRKAPPSEEGSARRALPSTSDRYCLIHHWYTLYTVENDAGAKPCSVF